MSGFDVEHFIADVRLARTGAMVRSRPDGAALIGKLPMTWEVVYMAGLKGKRILVVEDEVVINFAIEDMLEALGCEVTGAAHQIQPALELVELRQFDAAVLDVNIGGELIYGVADALAAKGIPYIFATGYGDTLHPKTHRAAPTLTKPYSIDDLAGAPLRFF